MATNTVPDAKSTKNARRAANTPTPDHRAMPSATILKRALPSASVEKANKVFANFTLSKFAKGALPANHVREHKNAASAQAVHREIISQQIKANNDAPSINQGMTLALPAGEIENLLPSYSEKAGTVDLSDVLNLLTAKMKGTEFYANGNPALNRVVLQSQVDQIIQSIKQEAKK